MLQYQLDSLEGIDESIQKLYIEKEGKFVLDLQGHEKSEYKDAIPKHRLDQEIEKRKLAEKSLSDLAEQMTEDVPEEFRDHVPELPPAGKIEWIKAAIRRGLFEREAGPIDEQRPGSKQATDLSNLSPQAMMAKGYGKHKN